MSPPVSVTVALLLCVLGRLWTVPPNAKLFEQSGGLIVKIRGPGFHVVAPWNTGNVIVTGYDVDYAHMRANTADVVKVDWQIAIANQWFPNATDEHMTALFVKWYTHTPNNAKRVGQLTGNPHGSHELEILRDHLEKYGPTVLGSISSIDIIDRTTGVLDAMAENLRILLQKNGYIDVVGVRLSPTFVQDGQSDLVGSRICAWWRRARRFRAFPFGSQTDYVTKLVDK